MAQPRVGLAITGTPGTGKSTLAALLAAEGKTVVDVRDLAARYDCILERDELDDAVVIDIEQLADAVAMHPEDVVYDGHMSHLLPVAQTWVIRCDPHRVRDRLIERNYREGKIEENIEAECLDLILMESLGNGSKVIQRDGTSRTPEELLSAFREVQGAKSKKPDLEPVDWSDRLLGDSWS